MPRVPRYVQRLSCVCKMRTRPCTPSADSSAKPDMVQLASKFKGSQLGSKPAAKSGQKSGAKSGQKSGAKSGKKSGAKSGKKLQQSGKKSGAKSATTKADGVQKTITKKQNPRSKNKPRGKGLRIVRCGNCDAVGDHRSENCQAPCWACGEKGHTYQYCQSPDDTIIGKARARCRNKNACFRGRGSKAKSRSRPQKA